MPLPDDFACNRFTALWNMSGTTRVSRYQKDKTRKVKTNLDLLEQEIVSGSGICWAIYATLGHQVVRYSSDEYDDLRCCHQPHITLKIFHDLNLR